MGVVSAVMGLAQYAGGRKAENYSICSAFLPPPSPPPLPAQGMTGVGLLVSDHDAADSGGWTVLSSGRGDKSVGNLMMYAQSIRGDTNK